LRRRLAIPVLAGSTALAIAVCPLAGSVAHADESVITVSRGDTLTALAERHGTTVDALAALNGMADPNWLLAGQTLRVPAATDAVAPPVPAMASPEVVASSAPVPTEHVVQPGEHLIVIAERYGTTVEALSALNGIANPSMLYVGTALRLPGAADAEGAIPPFTVSDNVPAALVAQMNERSAVRELIAAEAVREGVPVPLALALSWHESGWQQSVVSSAGAVGVMQLMPETSQWIGEVMLGEAVAPDDLASNVRAGVVLLGHYLDRYDADHDLALAAYYQGQAATDEWGIFDETRPYLASIRAFERAFGG
jgi:N-acetylmuramoyl-L-alanine amidase